LRFLVRAVMAVFTRYFRISANIPRELAHIDEPYLLLANHYGRYDPFVISHFIIKPPNFISSDAILRDWPIGTFFKGLGAMPKKKGMRDSHIIREMVKVIRSGGALALFPEGTRSWTGETLYIDPSIAKLVKLLQVPVITAKMQGAYAFDPRWARPLRRAKMVIEYKMILTKEEVKHLSGEELLSRVRTNLYHDDIAWQRQHKIKIRSSKRAEHLDLVLFACPRCHGFAGFVSRKNSFFCKTCDLAVHVDDHGFLRAATGKNLPFDNVKDWFAWQAETFIRWVSGQLATKAAQPLFTSAKLNIAVATGTAKMQPAGKGTVDFYHNRLQINYDEGEGLLLADIDSLGPQYMERIEFFYRHKAYRLTSIAAREPGVKWELAINVAWYKAGLEHKMSPYFKHLVAGNA